MLTNRNWKHLFLGKDRGSFFHLPGSAGRAVAPATTTGCRRRASARLGDKRERTGTGGNYSPPTAATPPESPRSLRGRCHDAQGASNFGPQTGTPQVTEVRSSRPGSRRPRAKVRVWVQSVMRFRGANRRPPSRRHLFVRRPLVCTHDKVNEPGARA